MLARDVKQKYPVALHLPSRKDFISSTVACRIFVVDDFEPWRNYVRSTLQEEPGLQVIDEASDGLQAVQKTQELQPDLILLDIGLPTLNGIEAARRIRELSQKSKLLFFSENRTWDIVEEALRVGAGGFVVKSDAARELLPAVNAVLQGQQFLSTSLTGHDLTHPAHGQTGDYPQRAERVALISPQNVETARRHEVCFCSADRELLDNVTHFIGAALKAGNAAIVVATESHRNSLLSKLQVQGLHIGTAIEQGRYIVLDAADTLSMFMLNGMPDPNRFMTAFGNLILTAASAAQGERPRVAVFGECVHILWAQGDAEAALQMEKLGNQLINAYDVDILCGYSLGSIEAGMDDRIIQRICAEHSAVYCP